MDRRSFLKASATAALGGMVAFKTGCASNENKEGGKSTMFIHSVYFWLKEDLTTEQIDTFEKGLQSLIAIESVKQGYIGVPASTDREIIDRSYSKALIVIFDDKDGHDLYQEHPVHDAFRNDCSTFWSKVLIYDCVTG